MVRGESKQREDRRLSEINSRFDQLRAEIAQIPALVQEQREFILRVVTAALAEIREEIDRRFFEEVTQLRAELRVRQSLDRAGIIDLPAILPSGEKLN